MAPLPVLLRAAETRGAKLIEMQANNKSAIESLEGEIAEKRAEKSIAAQNAVRDLLKKKEALQKELKTAVSACALIEKAVTKLKCASDMGLSDWASLHEEKITLSDFALQRLNKGPGALEGLKGSCAGASLSLQDGALFYVGAKDAVQKLKDALAAMESDYEEHVDAVDEDTLRLLEQRGEFSRISKKHVVSISKEGCRITIAGAPKATSSAADAVRGVLSGRENLDCPKALVGAAKAYAKDLEAETGALLEVWRTGGWGGGGVVCIRGEEACVEEAREKLQAWLDEREGAYSEFLDISKDVADWDGPMLDKFQGDLQIMGQNFGIAVKQRETLGQLEFRGPWEAVEGAKKEFDMILEFYRKEHAKQKATLAAEKAAKAKAKAKAKLEPKVEDDDDWGDAPVAEPTPMSWK